MKWSKTIKWILVGLVTAFIAAQFFNPPRTNPPVKNDFIAATAPPPKIAALLHSSCYDCHSHETIWPWYSHVAPVSWQVVGDVNEGREHLNLSDWPQDQPERAARKLGNMSENIGYHEMPLKKYTLIHRDARLTESQRKELMDWLDAKAAALKSQN